MPTPRKHANQKARARANYLARQELYVRRAREYRIAMRSRVAVSKKWVWNYKSSHACVKCGESDPIVIDFHHRDPSVKEYLIGNMVAQGYQLVKIQEEVAKCDTVCANCHRRIHYLDAASE